MALAIAKAAPLRPEIKLSQALREYEAVLSVEQKLSYNASPPNSVAVMALTCEIDRQNAGRKTRRYGARLTSFLNSVNGFASIVDLIIGSVGNPIASAVWGAVKLSIQIASGFESYFDSLSTMLMNIGLNSPRFEKYALLYPASTSLQKELCNYYAVVVSLCTKIVPFVRKPVIKQIASALHKPFDDEFGKLQKDLTRLGTTVKEEVSLASKQLQSADSIEAARERNQSSLFRAAGAVFRKETANELERARKWRGSQVKSRFLNSCSKYNNETALNQARKKGGSSWIFETEEYQDWRFKSFPPSTLLCSGIVGAGKTVVCASVVENLILEKATGISVGYFFCRDDEAASLKAREIIGSLARQLFEDLSTDTFSELDATIGAITFNIEQIVAHMQQLLPQQKRYYMILDGLDECEDQEVDILVESLRTLMNPVEQFFKLFWTGRSDFAARISEHFRPDFHIHMSKSDNSTEIAEYVEVALENALENGRLKLRDPQIIVQIQNALESEAQGMFLWVAFQIESLCSQNTDEDILNSLENLPRGLPATFRRLLRRLQHSGVANPSLGRKIFEIVAAAQRPLTLSELAEALSITPGDTVWNHSKIVNDVKRSLECCGSFITVDEELLTVHFPHSSVKRHLLSEPTAHDVREYHVDSSQADRNLGKITVTYLSLDILSTQLTKPSGPTPSYSTSVPTHVAMTALPPNDLVNKMALALLRSRRTPAKSSSLDLERSANRMRETNTQAQGTFSFLPYCQTYWLHHSKDIHFDGDRSYKLFLHLASGTVNTVELPWAPEELYAQGGKLFNWVSESRHSALIEEMIEVLWQRDLSSLGFAQFDKLLGLLPYQYHERRGTLRSTPPKVLENWLMVATKGGYEAVVQLLVQKGVNLNNKSREFGHVLQMAVYKGRADIAQILIDNGADVNIPGGEYGSPLHAAAATSGMESIAALLIGKGAYVNALRKANATPLITAVAMDNKATMRVLLRGGANVNMIVDPFHVQKGGIATALTTAVATKDREAVMIRKGVYASKGVYATALTTAVADNNSEAVIILLEAGADVSPHPRINPSPLSLAAKLQNPDIVSQLINKGAWIDFLALKSVDDIMQTLVTTREIAVMIRGEGSERSEDYAPYT